MIFYRVGNIKTNKGLWYSQEGVFHGNIRTDKYKELSCSDLPMPFNPDIKGYLSCVKTLEELKPWFNEADLKILEADEYYITMYESDDYYQYENHWMMRDTATVVKVFKQGYPLSGFYPPAPKKYRVIGNGPYDVVRAKDYSNVNETNKPHYICDKPGDANIKHMKDALLLTRLKNTLL